MCCSINLFVLLNLFLDFLIGFLPAFILFGVAFWARASKTAHDIRPKNVLHSAVGSKDYSTKGRKTQWQSYSRYILEKLSIGPGPFSHHRKNCCPSSETRMGVIHPRKWLAEDGWGDCCTRRILGKTGRTPPMRTSRTAAGRKWVAAVAGASRRTKPAKTGLLDQDSGCKTFCFGNYSTNEQSSRLMTHQGTDVTNLESFFFFPRGI